MNQAVPTLALCLAFTGLARAGMPDGLESATRRGVARVKQAGTNWQRNKTCFSCHHQTLPMLAMREAGRAGLLPDAEWFKSQAQTTLQYFEDRIEDMDEGEHVPGGAATTGFGFWALSLAGHAPDKTTESMVAYLLQIQGVARLRDRKPDSPPRPDDGRWQASCRRAPMQASLIGDTVLAQLLASDK